jgi:hypothetical protein
MRKRAKHTLSHYRMHTAEMGELFPVGCVPVLPGDTFQHNAEALIRLSPLNTPVMHPTQVRIHHFFVPNRIVWDGWEEFITGGPDGNSSLEIPTVTVGAGQDTDKKSVTGYLGVPAKDTFATSHEINALPLRAFNLIYNEWYRDQDLGAELDLDQNVLPRVSWEKDYFTTSRPFTQRGPGVGIPVAGYAPVGVIDSDTTPGDEMVFKRHENTGGHEANSSTPTLTLGPLSANESNVWADLSETNFIDVNEFRQAFAIQRYQEARARYGSRFTEYLRYLGINPSDARLQRPELLGGGTTRLNFSEVLQTTPGGEGEAGVGDLYGHGIAGMRTNRYRRFFEEHGFVISCMSVRPKSIYLNGAHREFLKTTKEDYFQRELANLGQQPIYNGELDMDWGNRNGTFGYQDRYDEYRQHWSFIGQDFRDTLASWHMGRNLTNPTLNNAFIACNPSKDIFQVTDGDPLWIMVNHKLVARRMVPKRANPRVI